MQLVPIKVPIPYCVVQWKTDERGRDFAPIPAFGELVRLSKEEEQRALAMIEERQTEPVPLVFEIGFADGSKGLFMAKSQAAIVENPKGEAARGS